VFRIEPFPQEHLDEVVALCAAEGWPSWTRENAARAFSAPNVLALVALEENEVVGVAELLTDGEVMAYLALLVVSMRARRRGIGRALIRDLFARSGLSRMDLLSEKDSPRVLRIVPAQGQAGIQALRRHVKRSGVMRAQSRK
jgi:ribosomal protein S18 acetylase RimI-like enzyme